jgi:hypothetical protein
VLIRDFPCSYDWPCHVNGRAVQRERPRVGRHRCKWEPHSLIIRCRDAILTPITALSHIVHCMSVAAWSDNGICRRLCQVIWDSTSRLALGCSLDGACLCISMTCASCRILADRLHRCARRCVWIGMSCIQSLGSDKASKHQAYNPYIDPNAAHAVVRIGL